MCVCRIVVGHVYLAVLSVCPLVYCFLTFKRSRSFNAIIDNHKVNQLTGLQSTAAFVASDVVDAR